MNDMAMLQSDVTSISNILRAAVTDPIFVIILYRKLCDAQFRSGVG